MSKVDDLRVQHPLYGKVAVSLEEINKATLEVLNNQDFYQKLLLTIVDPLYLTETGKAAEILFTLAKVLKKNEKLSELNSELYKKYQDIVHYLRWACLSLISTKEMEELFSRHIMLAFDWEIDINGKVQFTYIEHMDIPKNYDRLKEAMLRGLKANQEQLGDVQIELTEGQTVKSNISNWLKDYDRFSVTGKRRGGLEQLTYMNENRNVRNLTIEEKEILVQILKVYDFLRFPARAAAEVRPTPHRVPRVPITPPELVKAEVTTPAKKPPEVPEKPTLPQQILSAYQGDPIVAKAIAKDEEEIASSTAGKPEKLRDEFYKAVQARDKNRTVAAFRVLAKTQEIEKFLREDEKLKRFLNVTWLEKYGKQFVKEFKENPAQPKFIKAFLQYILQERLEMSENDAGRVGLQIANIFKQQGKAEYEKMAYYDVKERRFKWFREERPGMKDKK